MHPRSTRKDRFRIFRCCGDLRTHQITYRLAALRALLFVFLFTTGVLTNSSVDIVLHDNMHTATLLFSVLVQRGEILYILDII